MSFIESILTICSIFTSFERKSETMVINNKQQDKTSQYNFIIKLLEEGKYRRSMFWKKSEEECSVFIQNETAREMV